MIYFNRFHNLSPVYADPSAWTGPEKGNMIMWHDIENGGCQVMTVGVATIR